MLEGLASRGTATGPDKYINSVLQSHLGLSSITLTYDVPFGTPRYISIGGLEQHSRPRGSEFVNLRSCDRIATVQWTGVTVT